MPDKLRVATVGTGYFSQFHYGAWSRMAEVELVALCTLDAEQGKAVAASHAVPRIFDDVGAMLDDASPDLLDIITPPQTHAAIVAEAAARGIDAICQKPLAPSLAEAEALVEAAERAGITLIVHENFRFQPWYRHARRLLDEGRLGRPHSIHFRMRPGDGQGPEAYLGRQPYFQKMPRFLVHETGIHFIDSFRFLMGEVSSVYARLRRLNPVIAGEDAGYMVFDFEGGATGLFDGNRLNDHVAEDGRFTMGEMHLEGSAGVLRLDGLGRLWWKPHGGAEVEEPYNWEKRGFGGDSVLRLQRHAIAHLREGAPLENSGRDYLTNVRIEEAVYESSESGRRVDLAHTGSSRE